MTYELAFTVLQTLFYGLIAFFGAVLGSWWAQSRAPVRLVYLEPTPTNYRLYDDGEAPAPYPWSPEGLADRYRT